MRFLAAITLALVVTGCSLARQPAKSKFTGAQAQVKGQVADTLSNLEAAAKKLDKAKICNQILSTSLVTSYGGPAKCKTVVGQVIDDADATALALKPQTAACRRLKQSPCPSAITLGEGKAPTTATAQVTAGSGSNRDTGTVKLVKQGQSWRIDSFG
jgi:hypothetical protein